MKRSKTEIQKLKSDLSAIKESLSFFESNTLNILMIMFIIASSTVVASIIIEKI